MNESEQKGGGIWEILKVVIISLAIVLPIRFYVAQPFVVEGASMEPNFKNGEYLIIDELSYAFRKPTRGEVIVFRYPRDPSEYFIKRIIGLPGETIEIKNNIVGVQEPGSKAITILREPYIPANFQTGPDSETVLAANQYFVMGDNRTQSSDSRIWGILPTKNITGRVLIRLWPVARASLF